MTKKDYVRLAKALQNCKPADPVKAEGWAIAAYAIAKTLEDEKPHSFSMLNFVGAVGASR